MNFVMMAIYDTKARAFNLPFFVPHVDVGIRAIATAANDPGHQFHQHPADFHLIHLGSYDDDTGQVTMLAKPDNLGPVARWRMQLRPEVKEVDLSQVESVSLAALRNSIVNPAEE